MLTGSIKALIAKYGRQRLVRSMRGYQYLKQSGEIGRLNTLQYALTVMELRSCLGRCSLPARLKDGSDWCVACADINI